MSKYLARQLGKHGANHLRSRGWLDLRSAISLYRDPTISMGSKGLSLAIGFLLMLVIQALEIPLEGVLAAVIPVFGALFDLAFDGVEFVVLPILLGAIVLRRLNPRA